MLQGRRQVVGVYEALPPAAGRDLRQGQPENPREGVGHPLPFEAAVRRDAERVGVVGNEFRNGAVAALALAQRLLGLSALGDVTRDRQQGRHAAGRVAERRGVAVHPSPGTPQGGHLELEVTRLATEHPLDQLAKRGPVLLDDERGQVGGPDLRQRSGLEHPQAGGVDVDQPATGVQKLHALRLGVEDGAQASFSFGQRIVRPLQGQALLLEQLDQRRITTRRGIRGHLRACRPRGGIPIPRHARPAAASFLTRVEVLCARPSRPIKVRHRGRGRVTRAGPATSDFDHAIDGAMTRPR